MLKDLCERGYSIDQIAQEMEISIATVVMTMSRLGLHTRRAGLKLTLTAASFILGVSVTTVARLISEGKLIAPASKPNHVVTIDPRSLVSLVRKYPYELNCRLFRDDTLREIADDAQGHLLTIGEAAEYLEYTTANMYALKKRGKLSTASEGEEGGVIMIGGHSFYQRAALDALRLENALGYMTIKECANSIKVPAKSIQYYVANGKLPSILHNNVRMIKREDWEMFKNQRRRLRRMSKPVPQVSIKTKDKESTNVSKSPWALERARDVDRIRSLNLAVAPTSKAKEVDANSST